MKKIVLVCGLIAGAIVTAMMVITIAMCYQSGNFEGNMWLGYATMLLAFSLIFVGIKNYRDKHNNGFISFGKAFKTGLYITLIASTIYVAVWLISYYFFFPDFMDKYSAYVLEEAKSSGETAAQIQSKTAEMSTYQDLYKNPLFVVLFTYFEILPVGLIVTIISALILKRKQKHQAQFA